MFRTQFDDCITCAVFCIAFIKQLLQKKFCKDNTNSSSPNDYQENDKIIHNPFNDKCGKTGQKPWL